MPNLQETRGKTDVASYKLVSMYSSVGRLLEIIVNKHFNEYFKQYHLLNSRQHGGLSVTINLLMADNIIANYVEDNVPYDMITFDLARAFDRGAK